VSKFHYIATMFGTLSLTVLLAVQALLAHANPAVVEVELIKRTCVRRRSPGGLIKRNDCTTTLTTCPVTPTVTTTTTTITTSTKPITTTTTKVIYVPTTTTTTTREIVYVTVPTTTTTTTTEKETKTTTTTTTTCPATTPPPGNCDLGTAFGLGDCCSTPLNAAPAICTRWGWYITAIPDTTSFPITGTLWVGAGQNDVSKGTDVGGFTITKDGKSYTITYMLDSGFSATEVHIYAACTKPTTCAPGQFNLGTSPATITLDCPTVYFVLHAKVSGPRSAAGTCPTPAV